MSTFCARCAGSGLVMGSDPYDFKYTRCTSCSGTGKDV